MAVVSFLLKGKTISEGLVHNATLQTWGGVIDLRNL